MWFKIFLLKKYTLTVIILIDMLFKDNSAFNRYNELIYSNIFNKTTKNTKNKDFSGKIFNNITLNKIQSIFNYCALAIGLNSNFNESSTMFYFLINSNNPLKIIKGGGNINVNTFFRVWELEIRGCKLGNALNMVLSNIICLFLVFLFFLADFYCLIFFILIENKSMFLSIIANFISFTNVFSFNTSSNNTNKFNNIVKNTNKALNILDLAIKRIFVLLFYKYFGCNKKCRNSI